MNQSPEATQKQMDPQYIADLEARLEVAEETLAAIQSGEVDAVVVNGKDGQRVYTLESADRPYRILIEKMQEGAVTLSDGGVILYCNQAFADMLDTPVQRVIGASIEQFILPEERPLFRQVMTDAGKAEFVLKKGLSESVQTFVSFSELPEEESRILCGVVTDISLHKQRMQELAEKNRQLQKEISERERTEDNLRQAQKMEAVGQLTGGLAHDFNNLLTVILGNLQLIAVRSKDNDRLGKYVTNAIGATERGASLTQKLLTFSRRQSLKTEVLLLSELLPGIEMLARQVVGFNTHFTVKAQPGLWHCRTDAVQLESAVLNLIINARDAMPNGGTLSLQAYNETLDEAGAQAVPEAVPGKYVVVSVSDSGTGIPTEVQARIFEPFFTTKEVGKGSGLGLSMVYGLVRQSNGFVELDSSPQTGTCIRLYLPYAASPAGVASQVESQAPHQTQAATILMVEDDRDVLQIGKELLEELGYTVKTASNAREALTVLDSGVNIDLIFTDVMMPGGISGIDLARELQRKRSEVPILLTSGYVSRTADPSAQLSSEFRLLQKPYNRTDLAEAIETILSLH